MPAELTTPDTPAKPTAPPCIKCGTPYGLRKLVNGVRRGRPLRYNVERFGLVGMSCKTCYQRMDDQEKRDFAKQGLKREPRNREKFTPVDYVPTPSQIAEAARVEREAARKVSYQAVLLEIEAKDEAARRRCAKRAEIERADARAGRQRVMRAMGVRMGCGLGL